MSNREQNEKRDPSDELLSALASNVVRLRAAKKWSQEKLGDECDFHPTYISMVENKKRNITISSLEILASALDVKPSELLE